MKLGSCHKGVLISALCGRRALPTPLDVFSFSAPSLPVFAGALAMSVNLKQELSFHDYMAPFIVFITFFGTIFLISFTVLNYLAVTKKDDLTVFEEWGYRHKVSLKMGPHAQQQLEQLVPQKRSVASITAAN
uniref:Neur_chan_memb domain-containing protein n=1 Tax=Steinernema glaseri TaxID=37863 RepID=A0A1I8ARQ0_9BILA